MYNSFNYPNYQQYGIPQTNFIWVQGEAGAQAYQIAPGSKVILMDSENQVFYIKETDSAGIPKPMRAFEFKERVHQVQAAPQNDYVTKADMKAYVDALFAEKEKANESTV